MSAGTSSAPWIVSARFDLALFFGGLVGSLAAMALVLSAPVSIVAVYWIWLLLFDGPHMMAAYTRTYLDRDEWRRRPALLLVPLLAFAVGPVFLMLNVITGSEGPFLLFLGGSVIFGYHHVVRQHYGFLAIYASKSGERASPWFRVDRWCLYLGTWLPYACFMLTHPRTRAFVGLGDGSPLVPAGRIAALACAAGWALVFLVALGSVLRRSTPKQWYLLGVVALHGLIHLGIARLEPIYAASTGPDQDFLLMAVMVTTLHNVQYVALVWMHNRRRYHGKESVDAGPARWLSSTAARYVAGCVAFAAIYFAMARATGVFPRFQGFVGARIGPYSVNQLALCAWWGLAIHHYWLDQKIWRIGRDERLRGDLGIAQRGAT